MHRSCTVSSINPATENRLQQLFHFKSKLFFSILGMHLAVIGFVCINTVTVYAQEKQRESMEMSVVAVNPSNTKTQTIPIKMYLPKEVTPDAVIDSAGLDIEFDSNQSMYYLYKDDVVLKPAETKTFNVEIKDVWIIPQGRLDSLNNQAQSVIKRLERSEFYDSAVLLGEAIDKALKAITATQNDESVSRRSHIGIYRSNTQILNQVKEDVDRLERQLEIVMSLPKPEVLEDAKIKTESPAESTSWMIIFIIMLFIGMLTGVFFFTWQTQAHMTKDQIASARDSSFPEHDNAEKKEEDSG